MTGRREWTGAICRSRDPEILARYYPERDTPDHAVAAAVLGCRQFCPIQGACLQFALVNEEWFGIWGGTTERERRKMIKERRKLIKELAVPGTVAA